MPEISKIFPRYDVSREVRILNFFIEKATSGKDKAVKFISGLTLSSNMITVPFDEEIKKFLKQSVTKDLKLYRGMGVIREKVSREDREILNNLKVGDRTPTSLSKSSNNFASWTKKKSVARSYSEGTLSLILGAKVPKDKIIVDLEKLIPFVQGTDLEDDFQYYKDDKEVFVLEPIKSKIVFVKGKL